MVVKVQNVVPARAKPGLEGRRILLVSPRFFGYEQRICEHLRARGASVTYVDDRPSNTPIAKAAIRLGMAPARPRRYVDEAGDQDFDDVLVISPEGCSDEAVRRLRKAHPSARFILYMWDSFENKRAIDPKRYVPLFDRTLSFDHVEAERLGMTFRPLFFAGESTPPRSDVEYAFSFVGTIHSDRYRVLRALSAQADAAALRYFVYPFLPARFLYWAYRATKREFSGTGATDFRFDPLPYPEVLRVMAASRAIVDIEHPRQRGLTMRTLEVLGAGRKLLTTNVHVTRYPFYSADRVAIIDRAAPRLDPAFFQEPARPLPPALAERYSLAGWVDDILG